MLAVLGVAGLALAIDKLSGDEGGLGPASATAAERAQSVPPSKSATGHARSGSPVSDKLATWDQEHAAGAPEDAFALQAWMVPAAGKSAAAPDTAPAVKGFRVTSVLTRYGARLRREGDAADSPGRLLRLGEHVTWSEASGVGVTLVSVGGEGVVVEIDGVKTELRLAGAGNARVEVAPRARPETTGPIAR